MQIRKLILISFIILNIKSASIKEWIILANIVPDSKLEIFKEKFEAFLESYEGPDKLLNAWKFMSTATGKDLSSQDLFKDKEIVRPIVSPEIISILPKIEILPILLDKIIIGKDWTDSSLKLLLNAKITGENIFVIFYTDKLLIKAGAKINFDIIELKYIDISLSSAIVFIITTQDINAKYNGETLLMRSCKKNNNLLAKLLVNNGANLNLQDWRGDNALKFAHLNKKLIRLIACAGADLNTQNRLFGSTILQEACYKDNIKLAKILINYGANLNVQDWRGETALIIAASKYNTQIAKLLVDSGADVNIKSNNGHTALTKACANANIILVNILINSGAELNIELPNEDSPLSICIENNLLVENIEFSERNLAIIKILLDNFYSIRYIDIIFTLCIDKEEIREEIIEILKTNGGAYISFIYRIEAFIFRSIYPIYSRFI